MSRIVKAERIYIDSAKGYKVDYSSSLRPNNKAAAALEPHIEGILTNLHVSNSKTEAQTIINDAVIEGEKIKAQAEETRQQVHQEAWNKGYEAGYKECLDQGIKNAEHQYQSMLQEVAELKEQTIAERQELLRAAEKDTVQLSLNIAERIIHKELELDSNILVNIVRSVIDQYQIKSDFNIKISVEDMEAVDGLKNLTGTMSNIDISCDNTLEQGACIVDFNHSSIDAGVNTQLSKLGEAFSELDSI